MEHRFFVTLWILWLPQQILCKPTGETAVGSANAHVDGVPSDFDQSEENGEQFDGQWKNEELDTSDELHNSGEDSGENHEKVTPEQRENVTPETPKEASAEEPSETEPVSLSKRLEGSLLDEQQEPKKNGKGPSDTSSGVKDKTGMGLKEGAAEEPKKEAVASPAQVTSAEKSKWQTVRNQLSISADRQNADQNKRQPLSDIKNKKEPTKLQQPTSKPMVKSTGKPNGNRVELVGNISDLLTTVGKKINSFEDSNKRVAERNRLKRSSPTTPKLTKKSVPKTAESPKHHFHNHAGQTISVKVPPFKVDLQNPDQSRLRNEKKAEAMKGNKSPPRKEVQSSPKPKPSKAFGSPLLPSSKRDLLVDATKESSGMDDYERFMAKRAKQLDELEEKKQRPLSVKQLPKRLGTISGDFGAVANMLSNNIKSVSAANQDMISRRGSNSKTPLETVPLTRRGGPLESSEEYADDTVVNSRGENCKCYDKYSAFNVVRRTAKRVVRAVRHGANKIYEGVDFTIAKSKDLKDAVRADIVDPAVKMIPLVGPAVGAVVDTGDAISDSAISGARAVVQGGQQLNDGVLGGVEGMLKKDNTCVCANTRDAESAEVVPVE